MLDRARPDKRHRPEDASASSGWGGASSGWGRVAAPVRDSCGNDSLLMHQSTGATASSGGGWGAAVRQQRNDQEDLSQKHVSEWRVASSPSQAGSSGGWGGPGSRREQSVGVATLPSSAEGTSVEGWGVARQESGQGQNDSCPDLFLSTQLFRKVCCGRAVDDPVRATELPIVAHKDKILSVIETNQVVVITGETGSGKTTQIPQFIRSRWPDSSIIITQPRRIAATSIAKRVAAEMGAGRVGGLVGYQIGLKSVLSAGTRVLFCTTGILLRRLVSNKEKTASQFSHIILDEMHEMDMDMAFVLVVLKRLLRQYPKLKLVLMSATVDASKMARYFARIDTIVTMPERSRMDQLQVNSWSAETPNRKLGERIQRQKLGGWGGVEDQSEFDVVCNRASTGWSGTDSSKESHGERESGCHDRTLSVPIVNVSGRLFPVETVWIEEVFELLNPESSGFKPSALDLTPIAYSAMIGGCQWEFNASRPRVSHELVDVICRLILCIDRHDRDECSARADGEEMALKAVLVFMPGFGEIQALLRALSEWCGPGRPFVAIPLHSQVAREEQQEVFESFAQQRKVIVSTNIAESSLTVPDVRYVIDAGLSKEKCFDQISQLESLQTILASKASAKQRQGRAGRVGPGVCFRMYPREWWDRGTVPEQGVSEIQRSPLERLVLQTLLLEVDEDPQSFLLSAMDPPEPDAVRRAVEKLTEVGAVEATAEQRAARRCGRLTELGRVCSELPLDTHLTRLVLLGRGLGVMNSAIELAACISNTRLFRRAPPGRPEEEVACFSSRLKWSGGTRSDALAARRAYLEWKRLGARSDDRWARTMRVDIGALREIDELVKDVHQRLDNLLHQSGAAVSEVTIEDEEELLQLVLFGSCFPRVFVGKNPKYLSIDHETRPLSQTTSVEHIDPVVEVISAPPDATDVTIGEVMSQAGPLQRRPERIFQSRQISHWRVTFQDRNSWLSVPLALKIGDSNSDNCRTSRGKQDWRLGSGSIGHRHRAVFVPASDCQNNPVSIERESIGGTVVQSLSDASTNLVLCAAFVAATSNRGAVTRGGGVSLRCCSVMPSTWHDSLPLLAMLFASSLSVRTDRRRTRVLGVAVPGAIEAVALESVVSLSEIHEVNCFRAAITTALSDPTSVPLGSATVHVGRRVLSLLRTNRPSAKPRLPCVDHPVWNVSHRDTAENSAYLPNMGSCGLLQHEVQADDDSDEEACAARREEVKRLWSSAMTGGRGRSWCVCCRRSFNGGLLKHLRTEQHKRAEEDFVRGGTSGRR